MNRAVALVCGICHSVFSIPNPHTEFVPTLTNKKLSPYGSAWPFAGRLSSCVKVFALLFMRLVLWFAYALYLLRLGFNITPLT